MQFGRNLSKRWNSETETYMVTAVLITKQKKQVFQSSTSAHKADLPHQHIKCHHKLGANWCQELVYPVT